MRGIALGVLGFLGRREIAWSLESGARAWLWVSHLAAVRMTVNREPCVSGFGFQAM